MLIKLINDTQWTYSIKSRLELDAHFIFLQDNRTKVGFKNKVEKSISKSKIKFSSFFYMCIVSTYFELKTYHS